MNPAYVEHELHVGERVAVGGLPGGGMPLGDVENVGRAKIKVRMCGERLGVVFVAREQVDPIDWRCYQTTIARQDGFELRVDRWCSYWLWSLRPHHSIVRAVALDECTADLAALAERRVPWVECPCTIGGRLAQPSMIAAEVR